MCSKTPTPRDFLTLVAAKNNLQLISVLGVFPKRRFNTYVTKDVMVFLFSKEVQYITFFPKEIKNLFFLPRRSSISSFFQGGLVYHVFPKGDQAPPLFSKEVQHIICFLQRNQPLLVLIQEGTLWQIFTKHQDSGLRIN